MKFIIHLSFIFFLSINLLSAQTTPQPSASVKKDVEVLNASGLNLTDRQVSRITIVLMGQEDIATRNIKALEGNKSVLQTRLSEIKVHKINNIKGALTEQQVEKFNSLKLEDKL